MTQRQLLNAPLWAVGNLMIRTFLRIAAAGGLTLAVLLFVAPASARSLTDFQQSYLNVLKEYLPESYVDGLVTKLDEVDGREDLTDNEKFLEKKKILDREINRAKKAFSQAKANAAAGGVADPDRAAAIYLLLNFFAASYLETSLEEYDVDHTPEFFSTNAVFGGVREAVIKKCNAELERIREERKKAEKERAEKESKSAPSTPQKDGEFSFEGGFIAGRFDGPTQWYLATEPVLGTLVNGAFETDDDFWLYGGDFSVRYQPLGRQRFFELTFTYLEGDYSQDLGTFDAVGRGVGLPGTGDPAALFPNGVFFDAFGANNFDVIQNLRSTLDYRTIGGGFTAGHPAWSWNQLVVSPFAGIGVTRIDQRQTFGGDLPAYNVAFAYDTDYDLMRYQGRLGSRIECTDPTKRLRASFEGAATFNWTDLGGDDRLAIAGPVSDSQSVSLDDDEFSVGYSGDFRLNYRLGALPLELQLGGWIEHGPAGATVFRSGQTGIPSEAEIKSATIYAGRIGIKYSF
jgi:hypothetical protein